MTDDIKTIPLTQGQRAIVDKSDYETLSQWRWSAQRHKRGHFYAVRSVSVLGVSKTVIMHRVIMEAPKGTIIDHINNNGLDNRRSNLRFCTNSENLKNRKGGARGSASKYLGVYWQCEWRGRKGFWKSQITAYGKRRFLGCFKDEIKAALAYDSAARKYHGEFASPNFPELP